MKPLFSCLFLLACATAPQSLPQSASVAQNPATSTPTTATAMAPVATKKPYLRELQGERFNDDYFWLRNKGTPEVESYLKAEQAFTDTVMAPLRPLADSLYTEIVSHIAEDDASPPVNNGAYAYWTKVEKGKQYPSFLRKKRAGGVDEVMLDVNALAQGKAYMSVGMLAVSDNAKLMAYATDETGFRQYTLQFKDLEKGTDWPEKIAKVAGVEWAADSKTLFYVVEDEAKRPYRVYRHALGTDPTKDALVYEEKDERFNVGIGRPLSKRYIVIQSESKLTSEARLIDATQPLAAPTLVEARVDDRKYDVDDDGQTLIIRTNDTGRNYRLVTTTAQKPGRANWKELIAHDDSVMLESVLAFKGRLALAVRRAGLPEIDVIDLKSKKRVNIALPEPVHNVFIGDNREAGAAQFTYNYQSPTTPNSWFSYDFQTGKSTLVKEAPVPGGFDRTRYSTERIEATAKDGTKIPISVVFKRGVARDGSAPMLLEAYGSYGFPYPVTFNAAALALLDKGVVMAMAHIRGGGEMGKVWHEQGRLAKKMNTFTDFIACTEHLLAQKYTSSKRLVIHGGSAGGLLMGAVTNLRPDLFQAVVSDVPFVDVINTMNDATLPLTVSEYEEWGNPAKSEEYGWMRAYSPYDNLSAKAYPAVFVRSSYNDSQVMYWEPAKYVARMRALKTDTRPLLLKMRMEPAGHGGKSGRYERFRDTAEMFAFVLWQQGLASVKPQ
jgi:oligopeptidase B